VLFDYIFLPVISYTTGMTHLKITNVTLFYFTRHYAVFSHAAAVFPSRKLLLDRLYSCLRQVAEVHAGSSSLIWLVQKLFDGTTFVGINFLIMLLIHLKCLYVI